MQTISVRTPHPTARQCGHRVTVREQYLHGQLKLLPINLARQGTRDRRAKKKVKFVEYYQKISAF